MEPTIERPKITAKHIKKAVKVLELLALGQAVPVRSFLHHPLAIGRDGTLGFLYNGRVSFASEVSFKMLVEYIAQGDIEI